MINEEGKVFAQVKIMYIDPIPVKSIPIEAQKSFINIVDYMLFLHNSNKLDIFNHTENTRLASHFEDILDMMVYQLYFEDHMKENGLDVLQFIQPKPIIQLKTDTEKAEVIKEFYLWYQKPENPVRQRMLLIETRSPEILAVINKSVQ